MDTTLALSLPGPLQAAPTDVSAPSFAESLLQGEAPFPSRLSCGPLFKRTKTMLLGFPGSSFLGHLPDLAQGLFPTLGLLPLLLIEPLEAYRSLCGLSQKVCSFL